MEGPHQLKNLVFELEGLTEAITGTNNRHRKAAEASLAALESQQPENLISGLAVLLKSSQKLDCRQVSAVLLRQYLSKDALWKSIGSNTRKGVREIIVDVVVSHGDSRAVHRKAANVFAALAVVECSEWAELLQILRGLALSEVPLHREAMLGAVNALAEFRMASIHAELPGLKQMVCHALEDPHGDVRVAAMQAVISIVLSIPSADLGHMVDTIPLMFGKVIGGEGLDELMIRDAIAALVQLASHRAGFFKPYLDDVLQMMLGFASNDMYDAATRRIAFEFLCVMCENSRGMMRKSAIFAKSAISLAFSFLLEFDWDTDWENEASDDDQETFLIGIDGLARLSTSLGPKIVLPIGTSLVMQYIQQKDDWNKRFAALTALGKMADCINKGLPENQILGLVGLVLSQFEDREERVRFAAASALAQFCEAFGSRITGGFLDRVMSKIFYLLSTSQSVKASKQACLCVSYFFHNAPEENSAVLNAHVESLLSVMMGQIQSNSLVVQEAAVTALASVSEVCGSSFVKYYDHIVPVMLQILVQCTHKDQVTLRSKAVECIALAGSAVGVEKFGRDAIQLLDLLVPIVISQTGGGEEYIDYSYLHPAFVRIAQTIGAAFTPYLDIVVPRLLQSAQIESGFVMEDATTLPKPIEDSNNERSGSMVMTVQIRGVGERRVSINSADLQEKAVACNMLYQYLADLKTDFFAYVQPVASVLVPLVKYAYNDSVRVAAVASMPKLIEAAAPGGLHFVTELWEFIFPKMIEALQVEPDLFCLVDIVAAFGDMMRSFISQGGCLGPHVIDTVNEIFESIFTESLDRQESRRRAVTQGGLDEDEFDEMEEDNDGDVELMGNTVDCIQQMAKAAQDAYLPSFHKKLSAVFARMLSEDQYPLTRVSALCVFEEVLIQCSEAPSLYANYFLPYAMKYAADPDANVRQSACYGVGITAQVAPLIFKAKANDCLSIMFSVINDASARSEDNVFATDNAISSIGRICLGLGDYVELKKILPVWLNYLPISHDEDEVISSLELLCSLVENHPTIFVDGDMGKLAQIAYIFGEYFASKNPDPGLVEQIYATFSTICSLTGTELMINIVQSLPVHLHGHFAPLLQ